MKNRFLIIAFLLAAIPAFADEHGHEDAGAEIEISAQAVENYGIKTAAFSGRAIELPHAGAVASKDEWFVYEKDGEHFKQIEIRPVKITTGTIVFENEEGERTLAISGAKYLRLISLANANPEAGHGH
jgi:hypothetical protein